MRLTILFLALTLFTVAGGVYWMNDRIADTYDTGVSDVSPSVAKPVAQPVDPVVQLVQATAPPEQTPLYVSACIDSGERCRCLDPQGVDLKLEVVDCRAMLKLVNGQ